MKATQIVILNNIFNSIAQMYQFLENFQVFIHISEKKESAV
jgi:hypothetical protein